MVFLWMSSPTKGDVSMRRLRGKDGRRRACLFRPIGRRVSCPHAATPRWLARNHSGAQRSPIDWAPPNMSRDRISRGCIPTSLEGADSSGAPSSSFPKTRTARLPSQGPGRPPSCGRKGCPRTHRTRGPAPPLRGAGRSPELRDSPSVGGEDPRSSDRRGTPQARGSDAASSQRSFCKSPR